VTDFSRKGTLDTNARSFIKRDGINWISVTAFTVFHVEAVVALFFFSWPAFLYRIGALLDFFELGHRNGVSPFADSSFLPNAEVDRVFLSYLRHASVGRRAHGLGCNAPHPSPVLR